MSLYHTDTIDIINVTKDPTYGEISETIQSNISCRVENTNKMYYNSNGEKIEAKTMIFLPFGTSIKIGDKIQVKTIMGSSAIDTGIYEVREVFPVGGFGGTHLEVII